MEAKVVLATRNQHKIREIRQIFFDTEIIFQDLNQWNNIPEIIEDGNSFKENATKKALVVAKHTGHTSLADDSGIELDYLDGAPGIYSARFAGETATDIENNEKLLCLLKDAEEEKRIARYRCVIAIATPAGHIETTEGICEGRIALSPEGMNGFGYDPIFYYPPLNQTFGVTDPELKNKLSHRYHALMNAKPILLNLLS